MAVKRSIDRNAAWCAVTASALFVGAQLACDQQSEREAAASSSAQALSAKGSPEPSASTAASSSADRNCCMGLNECKGKGGCAVPESHACRGQNACQGKGGCNAHCPM